MEQPDPKLPVVDACGADILSVWGNHTLVSGVEWKIMPGEYWVVGGAHGSGKTDLLTTMAGLRRPAVGTVRIMGQDMTKLSEAQVLRLRTRIGFVFKGGGRMFTELSVAENIALGVCYHNNCRPEEAHEEVSAALDITGLTHLAEETAEMIGSDWQQRVGLARALALKPEVLFLDEPSAGLEARHRQWWRDFLVQLSAGIPHTGGRKLTVIAAANDFALWHGGNHRFAVIKSKRLFVSDDRAEAPNIE